MLTLALALAALTSIRVPLWNSGGEGIRQQQVSAKLNGGAAKVLRLYSPSSDLIILLVLDLAGDLSLVDPARESMAGVIEKLPPTTHLALMRAQDGLKVLADPTNQRPPVMDGIRQLTVGGRAGLLDSVEAASEVGDAMLTKARVRVALLYVTDSVVSNYREDFTNPVVNSSDSRDMSRRFPEGLIKEKLQQIRVRLLRLQTPLFIVHLAYQNDRLNEAYQTGLLELAGATGGLAEFCRSVADIPSAIEKMFESIAAHQSVELELKPGKAKQLDIELSAEGHQLRYRTHLHLRGN